MTPQEYAVRAVRAWVTNVDLTTIPELQKGDDVYTVDQKRDRFVAQVLSCLDDIVGPLAYAVIAERQDEEWQHLKHAVDQGEVEDGPYPIRFTGKGEVVR